MTDALDESTAQLETVPASERQFGEWYPIETAPIHPFNAEKWFMPGVKILLWANWAAFGNYRYTQRGKGKWESEGRNIYPTHWMPAPKGPNE